MMRNHERAAREVETTKTDWAEFCHALHQALARSEDVCRRYGLRFEAAALKLDLERELDRSL